MDPEKEACLDTWAEMNDSDQHIRVEAFSGYKANERPVAFIFQGHRWEISEILDRWYEGGVNPEQPVMDYFKVKTSDGSVFILREHGEDFETGGVGVGGLALCRAISNFLGITG